MKPYYEENGVTIHHGDCLDVMADLPENSVDTIITDPPYGLEFMGKEWDAPWRSDWQSGGGFSSPGIGERKTPWPSFSATNRFGGANPTCGVCGGRARGAKRCQCEHPQWKPIGKRRNPENEGLPDDVTSTGKAQQMLVFQEWNRAWAAAALRVAKPGAFLLAFGGTRTYHRLACAIEDAGWEVRDCMMWIYGSGFPKSLDMSKALDKEAGQQGEYGDPKSAAHAGWISRGRMRGDSGHEGLQRPWMDDAEAVDRNARQYLPATDAAKLWSGWGTALKPAWEPIIVAMKPLDGTFAENAQRHGVAGLNIDGGRIAHQTINGGNLADNPHLRASIAGGNGGRVIATETKRRFSETSPAGRWPANVVLDEVAAGMLDEQSGESVSRIGNPRASAAPGDGWGMTKTGAEYDDAGGASRFFYCAKASRSERESHNNHPTVKPLDLMRYLCRLTATPTGGTVLDMFAGSGTTLLAAREEGRKAIGIEREEAYVKIEVKRLEQGVLFGGAA